MIAIQQTKQYFPFMTLIILYPPSYCDKFLANEL